MAVLTHPQALCPKSFFHITRFVLSNSVFSKTACIQHIKNSIRLSCCCTMCTLLLLDTKWCRQAWEPMDDLILQETSPPESLCHDYGGTCQENTIHALDLCDNAMLILLTVHPNTIKVCVCVCVTSS